MRRCRQRGYNRKGGIGRKKNKNTSHVQVSRNDSPRETPLPPFKMTIYRKVA
jgi:hypothetical protein